MFGANIGTTAGKRTAALHTVLNMISTVLGTILLVPYAKLIQTLIEHLKSENLELQDLLKTNDGLIRMVDHCIHFYN